MGRLLAGLLLPVLAWLGCAPPRPPEPPPPAAFYWQAESPDGAPLFLLGSVHVGDGRELAPHPVIEADWARAEELVVEADVAGLPDLERLEVVRQHGLLPPDRTLRDVLPAPTWALLVPYLRAHHFSLDVASRMRPWMLAQLVAQLEFQAAGYEAENGVDAWFLRRAAAEGRPVRQLESLDEQLGLFGALAPAVEARLLGEMLAQSDRFVETTHAILRAWERGDEALLLELLLGGYDDPELAEFHRTVFVERNHRMALRLAALGADGRARFAVIGTGHLIGPESVPALLAAAGFAVTRRPEAFVRAVPLEPPIPESLPAPEPSGAGRSAP